MPRAHAFRVINPCMELSPVEILFWVSEFLINKFITLVNPRNCGIMFCFICFFLYLYIFVSCFFEWYCFYWSTGGLMFSFFLQSCSVIELRGSSIFFVYFLILLLVFWILTYLAAFYLGCWVGAGNAGSLPWVILAGAQQPLSIISLFWVSFMWLMNFFACRRILCNRNAVPNLDIFVNMNRVNTTFCSRRNVGICCFKCCHIFFSPIPDDKLRNPCAFTFLNTVLL